MIAGAILMVLTIFLAWGSLPLASLSGAGGESQEFGTSLPAPTSDLVEVVDIDQGYALAEAFAHENYLWFWNVSDTRGVTEGRKVVNPTIGSKNAD